MAEASLNNTGDGNEFYRKHFHKIIVSLISCIFIMLVLVIVLLYQVHHRPTPLFVAINNQGKSMRLQAYDDPNLLSTTLIKWAGKAVIAAYTYDFYAYPQQLKMARPYFTQEGWNGYNRSIARLIKTITANKLFVNAVVSAPPVITNQGSVGGYDRVWRVQVPLLVTYISSEASSSANFMVTLMLVKVPTTENPAAIAIDQFMMR